MQRDWNPTATGSDERLAVFLLGALLLIVIVAVLFVIAL